MIDALLAILGAVGLVSCIIGTRIAMDATPIVGGDEDGALSVESSAEVSDAPVQIKVLRRCLRRAWRLLLVGFLLQLLAALGFAVLLFSRARAAI